MSRKDQEILRDNIDRELWIDEEDLNRELMDQPLKMRKYTRIKSKLGHKVGAIKQKLKEVEAAAHQRYSGAGRVKDVESKVDQDPEVAQVRSELNDAEAEYSIYEGVVRAFLQRHEALKEICANIRKEMRD